ncbi:class I SAM-dependent methyltransferase, partial [bacterium]|nr:class I SAM-dependent methyltransferase [bacterium]
MDEKTLDYYSQNAPDVFKRYDSVQDGIEKYFKEAFPQKGHILDIGAGSGRDVRYLIKDGHKAYGLEPCDKLRSLAIHKYPELSSSLLKGRLPDDFAAINRKFDGIICSAVLMHIPKEHLFDSIFLIKRILKPNGRALISIPQERGDIRKDHRDDKGRLYTDITAEYLELLFERIGFNLINKWINPDSMCRKGNSWATLLFRLSSSKIIRPIDQIESVLNRDRKVATYKLALFRALCEIAMTNFQRARWMPDGKVGIPIHDVVEKWIYYYWPILESSTFIPQIQGESESCVKSISFRAIMNRIIKSYHIAGGLSGFTLDLRNGKINTELKPIIKKLFTCLKNTI